MTVVDLAAPTHIWENGVVLSVTGTVNKHTLRTLSQSAAVFFAAGVRLQVAVDFKRPIAVRSGESGGHYTARAMSHPNITDLITGAQYS